MYLLNQLTNTASEVPGIIPKFFTSLIFDTHFSQFIFAKGYDLSVVYCVCVHHHESENITIHISYNSTNEQYIDIQKGQNILNLFNTGSINVNFNSCRAAFSTGEYDITGLRNLYWQFVKF